MGGIGRAMGNAAHAANSAANTAENKANNIGSALAPILNQGQSAYKQASTNGLISNFEKQNISQGQQMWGTASSQLGQSTGGIKGHVTNQLQTRGFSAEGAQQMMKGNLPNIASDLAMLRKHLDEAQNLFTKISNSMPK